jgi:hypothetical protein
MMSGQYGGSKADRLKALKRIHSLPELSFPGFCVD